MMPSTSTTHLPDNLQNQQQRLFESHVGDVKSGEPVPQPNATSNPLLVKGVFNRDADPHINYEFGGPLGAGIMMIFFPCMMYYFYICLWFYDGQLTYPSSWNMDGVMSWASEMASILKDTALPTWRSSTIYLGLVLYQFTLATIMPGIAQEGMPVPSLNGATLMYNCNALACWYSTLITAAILHYFHLFRLTELIDHFGSIMTVAIIWGFAFAAFTYAYAVMAKTTLRMSGNLIYDYFMGAALNPRIGRVDVKMFAEVRIPWILLFLISVGGACKQYEDIGYVTSNSAFMILATGLYTNACAKGEECIPQTWDMTYEKWGWCLSFWNFAGVPFTYSYSIVYIATHDPTDYQFSTFATILLYAIFLLAHFIFDTSLAQKSHFKMQEIGQITKRKAFPQFPWTVLSNPKVIKTSRGTSLLIDGWWAFCRKPNYSADMVQSATWGLCAGFKSPIPYFYPIFFFTMIIHRCGRDFERCGRKYGKDWEEYCRKVPYKFIPGVY